MNKPILNQVDFSLERIYCMQTQFRTASQLFPILCVHPDFCLMSGPRGRCDPGATLTQERHFSPLLHCRLLDQSSYQSIRKQCGLTNQAKQEFRRHFGVETNYYKQPLHHTKASWLGTVLNTGKLQSSRLWLFFDVCLYLASGFLYAA